MPSFVSSAKPSVKKWGTEKVPGSVTPHSKSEKRLLVWCAFLVFFSVLFDQGTKLLIQGTMPLHSTIEVIPGWFNITYVRNLGAAWSILSGFSWLLLVFGVAAGIVILIFFRRWCEGFPERYCALALIEGGIIGNSIDRLWYGSVIDFIHVHYYDVYHYPVFNIADCAICIGVGIFILSNLFRPQKKESAKTA